MSAVRRWFREWRITLWHQRHREIRRALRGPAPQWDDFVEVERPGSLPEGQAES